MRLDRIVKKVLTWICADKSHGVLFFTPALQIISPDFASKFVCRAKTKNQSESLFTYGKTCLFKLSVRSKPTNIRSKHMHLARAKCSIAPLLLPPGTIKFLSSGKLLSHESISFSNLAV